jgi:hypothetical protein
MRSSSTGRGSGRSSVRPRLWEGARHGCSAEHATAHRAPALHPRRAAGARAPPRGGRVTTCGSRALDDALRLRSRMRLSESQSSPRLAQPCGTFVTDVPSKRVACRPRCSPRAGASSGSPSPGRAASVFERCVSDSTSDLEVVCDNSRDRQPSTERLLVRRVGSCPAESASIR